MASWIKAKRKGFTLIELMIVVAIIGILAALAIPNFIRFQARSKQGEAKSNLKSLFTSEKSYYQEHDKYDTCLKEIGFQPERNNRYAYYINGGGGVTCTGNVSDDRSKVPATSPTNEDLISVDTAKYSTATVLPTYVTGSESFSCSSGATITAGTSGVVGTCPNCDFYGLAAGNIDNDPSIDSWFISDCDGTSTGACPSGLTGGDSVAGGGTPFNTYNDVNCP